MYMYIFIYIVVYIYTYMYVFTYDIYTYVYIGGLKCVQRTWLQGDAVARQNKTRSVLFKRHGFKGPFGVLQRALAH